MMIIFSSPVQMYRKSYCSHPGISIVAQMLKFLGKVFMLVDIGLKFFCCSITTHLGDTEVMVTDLEILCYSFWLKFL